jgi:hypothetical protein
MLYHQDMKSVFFLLSFLYSYYAACQITYFEHVAPIVKENCQSCHSTDDIGPMSLSTYDEVASYASMIKFVMDTKLMPPFKADYHKVEYANERSISEAEKLFIAKWIEDGLLEGTPPDSISVNISKAIEPRYDYTICMSESFEHYGIYYDQYQVFVLPTSMNEGKYIKEIHFEPGNKEIVRSATISLATKGRSSTMDNWDPRYGFFAYGNLGFNATFPNWYNWMPHTKGLGLDNNNHLYIPKDSEILMHIHYGPYGEIQKDSSCIHFEYADKPGPITQNVPLVHSEFVKDSFLIESDLKKRISSSFIIPVDTKLKSVTPLAHLLCRSWQVFAVLPDKTSISLLSIDDWDFHWKEKYIFKNEINLPSGTIIYASAIYDNTSDNPYNPASPTHTMKKGPHMFDENFECYFEFAMPDNNVYYLIKPFISTDGRIQDVSFFTANEDKLKLVLYDLTTGDESIISYNNYKPGVHTIQSSELPLQKGRYSISLVSAVGVEDTWWFVFL